MEIPSFGVEATYAENEASLAVCNSCWFSDNFSALTQMLSRKALLPLVVFLCAEAFPAKIVGEG